MSQPPCGHLAPRDEPSTPTLAPISRPPSPESLPQSTVAQPSAAPQGSSRRSETATFNRPRLIVGGIVGTAAIIAILLLNRNNPSIDPASGGRQPSGTPSEISNSKSQISNAATGWHGWPADAPPPAITPFDAEQAKQHQEKWASYLNVTVEYTNSIGMKFRLIPPGEFVMGSEAKEIAEPLELVEAMSSEWKQHWKNDLNSEVPKHTVILTQPVYLGIYEVTQEEYQSIMDVNPSSFAATGSNRTAAAGFDTSHHPVETVSWTGAAEFCAKLSQQEKLKPLYSVAGDTVTPLAGIGYRLPTEAEWEFSCRAGTTSRFWIGESEQDLLQAGWFQKNSGGRTHSVGELKGNSFGVFDLHGNVWEWVQDSWELGYYGQFQRNPATDQYNPFLANPLLVMRGGHYNDPASGCRASQRGHEGPIDAGYHKGFRVSLPVDAVRQSLKLTGPAMPKSQSTEQSSTNTNAAQPMTEAEDISEPSTSANPDRRAAEYVLSIGGNIFINENGRELRIGTIDGLPAAGFELTAVDLRGNQTVNDMGLANLIGCQHLTYLNLTGTKVTDAGLVQLQGSQEFTDLDLGGTGVSDVGLSGFSRCRDVTSLDLSGTNVSDAWLANFKHCKELTYLNLGNTNVSDAGLENFKDCKNLAQLDLFYTQASDAGMAHFKDCENLTHLHLGGTKVTDAGLAHFTNCNNVTNISLPFLPVSDAGLIHFKDCKNVTALHLNQTKVSDAGIASFKDYKNLATLVLESTRVSDAGIAYFKDCKNLTTLHLGGTQVTDDGLYYIRELMVLKELVMSGTSP